MGKRDYVDIEVIGVELKKGSNVTKKTVHNSAYNYSIEYSYGEPTDDAPKKTLVLYTADGVLKTKEFDGTWTIDQVSNWDKDLFNNPTEEL